VAKLRETLLNDGEWHHVTIWRNRNEVHLGIDPDNNARIAKGIKNTKILVPMYYFTMIFFQL
jgi:hypothetical protein